MRVFIDIIVKVFIKNAIDFLDGVFYFLIFTGMESYNNCTRFLYFLVYWTIKMLTVTLELDDLC